MLTKQREEILYSLGATSNEMNELLIYTSNAFLTYAPNTDDSYLEKWKPVIQCAATEGAAQAINRYLAPKELQIPFVSPENIEIELFSSIGGVIPIITAKNIADFEAIIHKVVYKGKDVPNISEMGASFAFGKQTRFIVLSDKPYSNIPAQQMGLEEKTWKEKSLIIRKHHECAHYFTKQFFGSSKSNLHDELIADFCGFYAAFGTYKANWFLQGMGLLDDPSGSGGRIQIYTQELSTQAVKIVAKLAEIVSRSIEEWSRSQSFLKMNEIQRIKALCNKGLLEYIKH